MRESTDFLTLRARYQKRLQEEVDKLRTVDLGPGLRRLSLFGSYARGRSDLRTDLDILIVMESDKPYLERIQELRAALGLTVDYDLLCYTPEEFEWMKETPFLKNALADEWVLREIGASH